MEFLKRKVTGTSILSVFLFLGFFAVKAQEHTYEFGKISETDWDLEVYENDPDAGAVVLFDIGSSELIEEKRLGLSLSYKRHRRIKILKKSGYSESEITLLYFKRNESIKNIKAASYNFSEGKAIQKEIEPESIFEEQINSFYSRKKFTLPDIQVGTIIEYSYELITPYDGKIQEWLFQSDIPTIYSEYSVTILPKIECYLIKQNIEEFDVLKESKTDPWQDYERVGATQSQNQGLLFNKEMLTRTYGLKDIPAFGDESYMTSKNDFITKMEFKISTDREIEAKKFNNYANIWPALSRRLANSWEVGGYLYSSSEPAGKNYQKGL